ncbi:MAG: hypothetical protein IPO21_14525 [Bacteroidales bacterium]|nr:hypothetical protein [Bacteroidales bacterium]
MKQKLEIKDLSPYFPYGIKATLSSIGRLNLDSEYPNEHANKIGVVDEWFVNDNEIGGVLRVGQNYSFDFQEIDEIDIHLRPLAWIQNEITHEGHSFIPSLTLKLSYPGEMIGLNPATWSYRVIQKLLEWHFDVFGLISKDMAVSY